MKLIFYVLYVGMLLMKYAQTYCGCAIMCYLCRRINFKNQLDEKNYMD